MRLIDADKLLKHTIPVRGEYDDSCPFLAVPTPYINGAPTVDAEIVKHGKWRKIQNFAQCSECMHEVNWGSKDFLSPYCPNCGAKMGGKGGERK